MRIAVQLDLEVTNGGMEHLDDIVAASVHRDLIELLVKTIPDVKHVNKVKVRVIN